MYINFWTMIVLCAGFYTIRECVRHICDARKSIWENKAKMKFMDSNFIDSDYKA